MNRMWKMLALPAVAAIVLMASPVRAEPPNNSEKLDELQKAINEVKKDLADLKKALPSATALKKDLDDHRIESTARGQKTEEQITELRDQLRQLTAALTNLTTSLENERRNAQKDMKDLRDELNALKERVAKMEPARPNEIRPAPSGTGYVVVTNTYPTEVRVRVNGAEYPVPSGQTLRTEVRAGRFTYQVVGITDLRERRVAADKEFPIEVYPLP
jgi:predicted RNase H-like nuclease (RuvC/YqgF family)